MRCKGIDLKLTNHNLEAVLAALPDPVFLITESGRYAGVYGGSDPSYYHDGSHLVGLSMFDVLPRYAAESFLEQIRMCLERRCMITFEYDLGGRDVKGLDDSSGPKDAIHFEGQVSPFEGLVDGEKAVIWVARNITKRYRLEEQLRRISETDPLTGIYNRRRFIAEITERLEEFTRYQEAASIIMLDLDNFKQLNDTLGHQAGDNMLCKVAHACRKVLRNVDLFARFGGEEFIVLLPHTELEVATVIAERLRQTVEHLEPLNANVSPVTTSVGVGCLLMHDSVDSAISRVDDALYRAKRAGRNRVEVQSVADTLANGVSEKTI
ncbi:deoxycytidine triphosphate deaminase [Aliidiomarina maris]|uniref:diguanylate cyclase n=1 Tax=Aliidiomarina maris TaxID=531312 RepID=A0A327X571_9GAMM|nr:diguanylate cyclase [Aliidiomarina maris]RUO28246.1 deoxycytidine triphosphate deaminase [Aliidiomarina maris]